MAQIDTQQEGSGENDLIAWLKENKLEKVKDKLIENRVDLEEMIELNENELKDYAKNDLGLNVIEIKRFVKGIQKLQRKHKTKPLTPHNRQKVIVSVEEENEIQKCNDKYNELSNKIENMSSNVSELKNHQKGATEMIESTFDKLFKQFNERKKSLINELNNISNKKQAKYNQKIDALKQKQTELKQCTQQCDKLIFESDMDRNKRKTKILNMTNDVLSKNDYENILIPATPVVKAVFPNIDNIIKNINEIGVIEEKGVSLPPIIELIGVDIDDITVKISHVPNQSCAVPTKYKLEIAKISDKSAKINDSNIEEMKLSWKETGEEEDEDEEEDADENEWAGVRMYCDSLDENTRYILRCAVENKNGWSKCSKIADFKTEEEEEEDF